MCSVCSALLRCVPSYPHPLHPPQGMGHRDAGVASGVPQVPGVTVGPGAINVSSASTASVAAAAVDSLFVGQMQPPGAEHLQQQQQ
jgi:hypothetical protein